MGIWKRELERFERLKAVLAESAEGSVDWLLSQMMARCGVDWHGRYVCRSPACPSCRRRAIRRQQKETRAIFAGIPNEELAFVSIVIGGTADIHDVALLLRKGQQDLRNRLRACRRLSSRWDNCAIRGWHEVDAVFPEQTPLLAKERADLISALAPISADQVGPTWFGTIHAIVYVGDVTIGEFSDAMRQQWPLARQVDVRPFHRHQRVEDNLDRLVSYSLKFTCATDVPASVWGGKMHDAWPPSAEAELCLLLHHGRRNAFEQMRFFIGQKANRAVAPCASPDDVSCAGASDEAMPFAMCLSDRFTTLPMYKYYYHQEVEYDQFSRIHSVLSEHFNHLNPP